MEGFPSEAVLRTRFSLRAHWVLAIRSIVFRLPAALHGSVFVNGHFYEMPTPLCIFIAQSSVLVASFQCIICIKHSKRMHRVGLNAELIDVI